MRDLKKRVERVEDKTGLDRGGTLFKILGEHTCKKNKGKIFEGCHQLSLGEVEEQECNTCESKDTCGQNKPERFKMLWEKHFKSKECKACTEKEKHICGLLDIQRAG